MTTVDISRPKYGYEDDTASIEVCYGDVVVTVRSEGAVIMLFDCQVEQLAEALAKFKRDAPVAETLDNHANIRCVSNVTSENTAADATTYGIWGGVYPYGWCIFKSDGWYVHQGPKEDALAGIACFEKEKRSRREEVHYVVIPYDPSKEPTPSYKKPTESQLLCLLKMYEDGSELDVNKYHRIFRNPATIRGLLQRGLVMTHPARVTSAGVMVLEKFHLLKKPKGGA